MGLLTHVIKGGTTDDGISIRYLKRSCKDDCKWRCDFDKEDEVFCHLTGQDLTTDQITILQLVGCGSWKKKEEISCLKNIRILS